jgi:cytochrome c-type biogenesis protein CcmH
VTALLILGAMALAGAGLLALPLALKRRDAASRAAFDRTVFRDQLEELERDAARGVISAADAEAARIEIARRILATAEAGSGDDGGDGGGEGGPGPHPLGASRGLILALAILAPLAAGGIYLVLGSPGLPGEPFAARTPAGPATAQIGRMVEMLEARLAERPDEIQGWVILSTAYLRLDREADAEKAYWKALGLIGADTARGAAIAVNYGEALVVRAEGRVTPRARAAFERALALAPRHPAAGYYLGLARLQAGDAEGALAVWRRIADAAPKDAPWLAELKARIGRIAKERGLPPGDAGGTSGGEAR